LITAVNIFVSASYVSVSSKVALTCISVGASEPSFSIGHLGNSDATALNRDIANGSPINDTPYVHYVMENDPQ